MKSTNQILLGIAVILFGGACLAVNTIMDIGVFMEALSLFCPFVGLAISILGAIKRD